MKKLLILSGKGGTGKTTVAASFIRLADCQAFADCDVDAPNLHLVMSRLDEPDKRDFYGMPKAQTNMEVCSRCGVCDTVCRFNAIRSGVVDAVACEGCGVCSWACPEKAIIMIPWVSGETRLHGAWGDGPVFSTAQLRTGSGNSGLLVTEVKKRMTKAVEAQRYTTHAFAIIDGSPGIGCPVIASLSGVDMVLIVTEPSVSGISDMTRILKTARGFHVPQAVTVNRQDVNPGNTEKIRQFCLENSIPFLGGIPYDPEAIRLVNDGRTPVDEDCVSGREIRRVYAEVEALMTELPSGNGPAMEAEA